MNSEQQEKKCLQCGAPQGQGKNCPACSYSRAEKAWFSRISMPDSLPTKKALSVGDQK